MRVAPFPIPLPAWRRLAVWGLALLAVLPARAGEFSDEFDRQRFRTAFQHEIAFREAALHVAWAAEPLCDDTSEIEPFVLWSLRGVRKSLSADQQKLFTQATGMDEHWRIAWLDEAAPEALRLGQRVVAVNNRPLPAPGSKVELTAVLRGGSAFSVDDQAFWQVMHQARQEAIADSAMTLTLDGGQQIKVSTQTGCAGTVTATAFDDEPQNFLRQEGLRSKIPGNAMLAAHSRDERRWLAAFGTYLLASERSILRQRSSDSVGNAFLVGKVLALAVPGVGTVLSAMESKTQRGLQVDGLIGGADLFANEVLLAMGGDPAVGLKLSDRLARDKVPADILPMSAFRRSNVEIQLQQLQAIETARRQAELAAEAGADTPGAAKPAARQ
ncbi:hypothetical protein [Pseudaquabacterium pictum]|uniref:Uncharacterized protein n=1 Tax=Pseudaquabacterium pictum TaxID=2315236 RepID=A0A480AZ26_9BURK|nr:hypothetical protein [Rubrivivax pictus]GCL64965.1 hypothetical protein AQPW35_40460 [Rubrivivax pictus]